MLEDKNPSKTPLSSLGEFGLIEHLTDKLPIDQKSTVVGIGDDAAVLAFEPKERVLTSTDMLVEGVHFDLSYMPLKHLGYKAAIVNFSDIYAMNGRPSQLLVSMAVSNRFSTEALEEIYSGLALACSMYKVDLVGGDTTTSTSGLILSLTAIGTADPDKVALRSGMQPNDLVVVSGDLGGAYMGLQILEREKTVFLDNPNAQPDLTGNEYVLERQLKPEARKDVIETLDKLGVKPSAMIDISDGLSSEALHLAKQSGYGIRLFEDKIPVDPSIYTLCEEFRMNYTTVALNGGEDYELLFTIPLEDHDKIKGNPHMTVIGHVSEDATSYLVTRDDRAIELTAQGWNPIAE